MFKLTVTQLFVNGEEYEIFVDPTHVETLKQSLARVGVETNYNLEEPSFMFDAQPTTQQKEYISKHCAECGRYFEVINKKENLCEWCAFVRDMSTNE